MSIQFRQLLTWGGFLSALVWHTHLHPNRVLRRYQPADFVRVDSGPIHIFQDGPLNQQTTLLIHGSDGVALDWLISPLWPVLKRHTRVIAYDRPGHGYSPSPVGRGVGISSNVNDLHSLIETLALQRVTLVGHSYGAYVALSYALKHPERVEKLVLISPVGFAVPGLIRPLAYVPLIPVLETLLTRLLLLPLGHIVALLEGRRAFWPAPVPQVWHRVMLDFSRRRTQVHALASENRSMAQELAELSQQYPDLSVPVTLLAGTRDCLTPPQHHARPLSNLLKRVKFQEISGGGHQLHWTHTAEVIRAILT